MLKITILHYIYKICNIIEQFPTYLSFCCNLPEHKEVIKLKFYNNYYISLTQFLSRDLPPSQRRPVHTELYRCSCRTLSTPVLPVHIIKAPHLIQMGLSHLHNPSFQFGVIHRYLGPYRVSPAAALRHCGCLYEK